MRYDKEGYYFSEITCKDIREEIEQGLSLETVSKNKEENFSVRYEVLEKAGILARRGSAKKGEELLREAGASDYIAREIVNGILNKADFYALLFMDFQNEMEPGYSVQYLAGAGLTLMEYEIKEDEDYITFLVVDEAQLQDRLQIGFDKIDCQEEQEEFQ